MRRSPLPATSIALFTLTLLGCPAQRRAPATTPAHPNAQDDGQRAAQRGGHEPETAAERAAAAPNDKGAAAPGGTVYGLDGKAVDLATTYADSNVVLVFYRGHSSRYSRRQLGQLEDYYPEIQRNGTEVYAVSTESAEISAELRTKLGLEYPVLVDPRGQTARAWGVLDEKTGLAKLSTFVIRRGGAIVFRHVAAELGDIPEPEEITAAVSSLGAAH